MNYLVPNRSLIITLCELSGNSMYMVLAFINFHKVSEKNCCVICPGEMEKGEARVYVDYTSLRLGIFNSMTHRTRHKTLKVLLAHVQ